MMMLELEMEGRAVGVQLGLGDGSTWTLEEIEPTFQGGRAQFGKHLGGKFRGVLNIQL